MACSAVEITAEKTTTKEHELAPSFARSDTLWSHMNNPSGPQPAISIMIMSSLSHSSKHVHVLAFSLAYSRSKALPKVGLELAMISRRVASRLIYVIKK